MYNDVYLTIGFIVDTSILSGALPRLYGRYIYTQWWFMVHIYIYIYMRLIAGSMVD